MWCCNCCASPRNWVAASCFAGRCCWACSWDLPPTSSSSRQVPERHERRSAGPTAGRDGAHPTSRLRRCPGSVGRLDGRSGVSAGGRAPAGVDPHSRLPSIYDCWGSSRSGKRGDRQKLRRVGAVRGRKGTPVIQAEGLTKAYGGVTVVDHLPFWVRPGVVTGFLG